MFIMRIISITTRLILDNEVAQWYLLVGSDSPQRLPSQLVENRFPCWWTLPWPSSGGSVSVTGGTRQAPLLHTVSCSRVVCSLQINTIRSPLLITRIGFILFLL